MSPRLQHAIAIAREAGDSTLPLFRHGPVFRRKQDASPVTAADEHAEKIVRARLDEFYPGEAILGEEQGGDESLTDRWVVDPIDGTKAFVAGVPTYSTLLSYEEAGEVQVGVVYFPALDELYYAEKGGGAFKNGVPIEVEDAPLNQAIISTGGMTTLHESGWLDAVIRLAHPALVLRGWNDAYGHMLVASGRCHAMIESSVKHWDISPVSLIVQEAKGIFMQADGSEQMGPEAISCTPGLKDDIVRGLAEVPRVMR